MKLSPTKWKIAHTRSIQAYENLWAQTSEEKTKLKHFNLNLSFVTIRIQKGNSAICNNLTMTIFLKILFKDAKPTIAKLP